MVKFLIQRPIGVIMSFIAILMLGVVSFSELPISLMPDIEIPEITVQVSHKNTSVREMETSIMSRIRRQLMQVPDVDDLYSETRDGYGIIHLKLKYGANNDIAFIEVNEKIDVAMRDLPKELERPRIIKASASDIPAFTLNISLKDGVDPQRFAEVSELCEVVIKKRIEQLPQVAIADVTGLIASELYIKPNKNKIESLGITQNKIQQLLKDNNISYGNIMVHEGIYQYSIQFTSALKTVTDVKNIYLKAKNKVLQLKDIAEIGIRPRQAKGVFLNGTKQAISFSIIKQSDAKIDELKEKMKWLKYSLTRKYPEIKVEVSQDQTGILEYTISNLKQSLILGSFLAFILMFFFLKDFKSPLLIGFSIPTSLVISLLFFYLWGISINIISLSGLILGIGMMIDNSIIVIDNISQYIDRGENLLQACIKGTNEIIKPLISSVLTTCAVFLPLIFLSGISGALFYDQAIAVTIGLFVSLLVSITLLPVLYRLFYNNKRKFLKFSLFKKTKTRSSLSERLYNKGYQLVFKNKIIMFIAFLIMIPLAFFMIQGIKKEKLPKITQSEIILNIDWNTNIGVAENKKRIKKYLREVKDIVEQSNSYVGEQQFLLNKDKELGYAESRIYLKVKSTKKLKDLQRRTINYLEGKYNNAIFSFEPYKTLFDRIFQDNQPDILARITSPNKQLTKNEEVEKIKNYLRKEHNDIIVNTPTLQKHIVITLNAENLILYDVPLARVFDRLKTSFNTLKIDVLKYRQNYLPIVITDEEHTVFEIINNLKIRNNNNIEIPITALVETSTIEDYKTLFANRNGKYIPVEIDLQNTESSFDFESLTQQIKEQDLNVDFDGKVFSGDKLLNEMVIVLLISLMLLYFILAAQFESLTQPFIILLEIPIDIVGVIFVLLLFGESLNLMSMIGIIVMSGIIINDSILKISTINQLRKSGLPLTKAIHKAGEQRLKPILMTSLTTILALLPFLFFSDLGSELQKPFALAIIGGMTLGTVVSLYFIPLCYYFIYRKTEKISTE